jgi:hypothetical protein
VPKRIAVDMIHKLFITEIVFGRNIYFNVMIACTSTFSMWSIPIEFSYQNVFAFHLSYINNNNNNNNKVKAIPLQTWTGS